MEAGTEVVVFLEHVTCQRVEHLPWRVARRRPGDLQRHHPPIVLISETQVAVMSLNFAISSALDRSRSLHANVVIQLANYILCYLPLSQLYDNDVGSRVDPSSPTFMQRYDNVQSAGDPPKRIMSLAMLRGRQNVGYVTSSMLKAWRMHDNYWDHS